MQKFKICNRLHPIPTIENPIVKYIYSLGLVEGHLIEYGTIHLKYIETKIILSKFYVIWGENLM